MGMCSGRPRRPVAERFWEKVDRRGPDECWEWLASRDGLGYGYFRVTMGHNMQRAHRVAWQLTQGRIHQDLLVCHHCDNPPCCNPAHLFLGTNSDNIADRDSKGRARIVSRHGEASHLARLTASQVREIRERYARGGVTQAALGAEYGVGQTQIGRIVRRVRWASEG